MRERGVGGRHAGRDRRLHQDFLDFLPLEAGIATEQRGAQMEFELLPATERAADREHDHASGPGIESGRAPDLVPGIARDQVLEFGIERIGACERTVNPRVAEHRAPVAQAAFEIVLLCLPARSGAPL